MFVQLKENPIAFVIAGPTASGKTQLAIDLAKNFKGIVINADSQQVYKDISILSSQPEKEKLTGKGIEKKKDESNVFKCNDCDSTFLYKRNLYRHIRAKHEHNFLCETCGKTFARREVYEKHKCHVKEKVKARHNLEFDENAASFKGLFNTKT